MTDFPLPQPSCIQYPRPSDLDIGRLLYLKEAIDAFLIEAFEKEGSSYDNSTSTTPESWRTEKERLDNYCEAWDHSKPKSWKGNRQPPNELLEKPSLELESILDRISSEAGWAQQALNWQRAAEAPKVRLTWLKKWSDEHNPIKACLAVRLYRAIFELDELSVEEG